MDQSMEFSRPEYWNGQPFPSPGDLLNSGIELRSLTLQADSLPAEPQRKPKNTGVNTRVNTGVNTGVGSVGCSVMSDSLQPQGLYVDGQAPLSMEFTRQFYCCGLPFSSPGDLLNSGIEPRSPTLQVDSLLLRHQGSPCISLFSLITGIAEAVYLLITKEIPYILVFMCSCSYNKIPQTRATLETTEIYCSHSGGQKFNTKAQRELGVC